MIKHFYKYEMNQFNKEHCVIPEFVNGVDEDSFRDVKTRAKLLTLTLHEGVDYIGDFSFKLCYSLRELTLPKRVEYFGIGVFQQCNKLRKITLPIGTKKIDSGMFVCCESLERLEIPYTVESIDPYAFSSCRALKEVKVAPNVFELLPASIKKIAVLTYFSEATGNVDESIGAFVRKNSYDIAKSAIEEDCYQAIDYMICNDMILKRDVPKLLDDAGRLGKTELSAMLIGAGRASESSDDMYSWDPFA